MPLLQVFKSKASLPPVMAAMTAIVVKPIAHRSWPNWAISWVEFRNRREVVKFKGAEAIEERSALGSTPEIASR
jgi:hypothetical protein